MAIAHLEDTTSTVLRQGESSQAARDSVVTHLWHKVIDQEHELTDAIRELSGLCASLTERIETQDRQQQELLEVIRVLGQKHDLPSHGNAPKLVGGSVFSTANVNDPEVIDVTEPLDDNEETVEDAPRRGDRWHPAR